jgi:hypothetical protein
MPVMTDAGGMCTLEGLPETQVFINVFTLKGYLTVQPRQVVPRGQEIRFVLKTAAAIQGFVKGPDGKPVPGLLISGTTGREGDDPIHGYSSVDGSFTLNCPPKSVVDISVSGSPMATFGQEREDGEKIHYEGILQGVAPPAEGVEIIVKPSALDATLGVLVLGPDGKPVPNVTVAAYGSGGSAPDPAVTGEDGRAELTGLPRSVVTVIARSSATEGPLKDAQSHVTQQVIPAGQEIVLQFARALVITGIAVDPAGEPIQGGMVQAWSGGQVRDTASIFPGGTFRLRVTDTGPYRLVATRYDEKGKATAAGSLEGITAPAEGITIILE